MNGYDGDSHTKSLFDLLLHGIDVRFFCPDHKINKRAGLNLLMPWLLLLVHKLMVGMFYIYWIQLNKMIMCRLPVLNHFQALDKSVPGSYGQNRHLSPNHTKLLTLIGMCSAQ